jgi:hypothetical protein
MENLSALKMPGSLSDWLISFPNEVFSHSAADCREYLILADYRARTEKASLCEWSPTDNEIA